MRALRLRRMIQAYSELPAALQSRSRGVRHAAWFSSAQDTAEEGPAERREHRPPPPAGPSKTSVTWETMIGRTPPPASASLHDGTDGHHHAPRHSIQDLQADMLDRALQYVVRTASLAWLRRRAACLGWGPGDGQRWWGSRVCGAAHPPPFLPSRSRSTAPTCQ